MNREVPGIRADNLDPWGIIPSFLDEADPRPAREQFNERYSGGWQHFPGGRFDPKRLTYNYPGDPPLEPVGDIVFRDEVILLYPYSIVLIVQPDGTWETCRMD